MRELFLVIMILATFAQAALLHVRFKRERDLVETRESLKKLAAITMQFFHNQDPPQGMVFWEKLGRTEPMRDRWGQEFQMQIFHGETQKEYIWRSAGPDRVFDTQDDLRSRVPYQKGVTLDLTHPGTGPDFTPDSKDAI